MGSEWELFSLGTVLEADWRSRPAWKRRIKEEKLTSLTQSKSNQSGLHRNLYHAFFDLSYGFLLFCLTFVFRLAGFG